MKQALGRDPFALKKGKKTKTPPLTKKSPAKAKKPASIKTTRIKVKSAKKSVKKPKAKKPIVKTTRKPAAKKPGTARKNVVSAKKKASAARRPKPMTQKQTPTRSANQASAGKKKPIKVSAPRKSSTAPLSESARELDIFGYDRAYENQMQPVIDFAFEKYFRVEIPGTPTLPSASKRAVFVCNHAGLFPYDAIILREGLRRLTGGKKLLRPLLEDFVMTFPFVGTVAHRLGMVRACQENARTLLNQEDWLAVFPEGMFGLTKLYGDRYKLQRFGRGGYIRLAIRTGAPLIPVAIVGSEEIHPLFGKLMSLGPLVNMPFVPLTLTFPWLGPVGLLPLPSKWYLKFGEPISMDNYKEDDALDPTIITRLDEKVRNNIEKSLAALLHHRQSIFG